MNKTLTMRTAAVVAAAVAVRPAHDDRELELLGSIARQAQLALQTAASFETLERTPKDSAKFYADVFGYRYSPLGPEAGETGDYEIFTLDGDRPLGGIGGMMGAPPGTPSHWLAYFTVADIDASVEAVGDGGGTVLMSP